MLGIQKRCPHCDCWIRFGYLDLCQFYGRGLPGWSRECGHCNNPVCTPYFWDMMTALVPLAAAFAASIAMFPRNMHPSSWVIGLTAVLAVMVAYLLTGLFRHLVLSYVELVEPWGLFSGGPRQATRATASTSCARGSTSPPRSPPAA